MSFCTAVQFVTTSGSPAIGSVTHIHHRVDLSHCFVVCGELIDLHAIADQLAHNLYLKLVQLALGDGVCFGNDRDNVHLKQKEGQSRGEQQSWAVGGAEVVPARCSSTEHQREEFSTTQLPTRLADKRQ